MDKMNTPLTTAPDPLLRFCPDEQTGHSKIRVKTMRDLVALTPYRGRHEALDTALATFGLAWPKPQERIIAQDGRAEIHWSGPDQAWVHGVSLAELRGALAQNAALTALSDGWATLTLESPYAAQILARLTPLDLRSFEASTAARSELHHLAALFTKDPAPGADGAERYNISVMRSFAKEAHHRLLTATRMTEAYLRATS